MRVQMFSFTKLKQLIEKQFRLFKLQIQEQNIEIKILESIENYKQDLYCDWTQYSHCLFNLIVNAVKYADKMTVIEIQLRFENKDDESGESFLHTKVINKGLKIPDSTLLMMNNELLQNENSEIEGEEVLDRL